MKNYNNQYYAEIDGMKKITFEEAKKIFETDEDGMNTPIGYLSEDANERIIKELDQYYDKSPEESFEFNSSLDDILEEFESKYGEVLSHGHPRVEITGGNAPSIISLYPEDFDWFVNN